MQTRYAVVGAGLAGASTARRLAADGEEVTLIERGRPADPLGSSHGSARILRYAYPDQLSVELMAAARPGWEELEARSGRRLLTATGALDHGEVRDPRQLAGVLEAVGVDHELLSARQAAARWPMLSFDTEVLWHPEAAVLDAESTVEAMVEVAVEDGARLLTGWEVELVERAGAGFRLTSTDGETLEAERVVVCAGGWLPALLRRLPVPAGFLPALHGITVRQEQAFHFPHRPEHREPDSPEEHRGDQPGAQTRWPTFIHQSAEMTTYGLPGGRDAGFAGQKVAEYDGGPVIDSAAAQDGRVDPENRRRVVDFVRRRLPGAEPTPYAETTCLFTTTPDAAFLMDSWDGLTVISPCSGHGAKFAPLIGELAAGLAAGDVGRHRPVPAAFRADRRIG